MVLNLVKYVEGEQMCRTGALYTEDGFVYVHYCMYSMWVTAKIELHRTVPC